MKKHKVVIDWTRTATVVENGQAIVLVDDPANENEIKAAYLTSNFHTFIPQSRDYVDEEWEFNIVKGSSDSGNTSSNPPVPDAGNDVSE